MDSSVYKYLIEKMLSDPFVPVDSLPEQFSRSPMTSDHGAMQSLGLFLRNQVVSDRFFCPGMPEIPFRHGSFFRSLFRAAHKALVDALSGTDPSTHPFRSNGIQLSRFLTFCVSDDGQALLVRDADASTHASSCAMFCFLLEGLMFCGLCPNSFERKAKRAAHAYFIVLKKTLRNASAQSLSTALGYLWGAWLLARKTEGIQSAPLQDHDNEKEEFNWKSGLDSRTYIARKTAAPFLFYVLPKCSHTIPHPVRCILNDGHAGLSIRINDEPVRPVSLADSIEINRQKVSGDRFVYNCATDSVPNIAWTIAVLTFESTIYRIDILKLRTDAAKPIGAPGTETMLVETEIKIECGTQPERCGQNSFMSKGSENTVVRFLDTPLEFAFDRMEMNCLCVYKALPHAVAGTLKIITAWSTGRGISAINETNLLGIYE